MDLLAASGKLVDELGPALDVLRLNESNYQSFELGKFDFERVHLLLCRNTTTAIVQC